MRWLTTLLALAACGGDETTTPDTDGQTPTGDTGPTATGDTAPPPGPDLVVLAEHDYALTASWTIASVEVRAGENALVGWSAITTDAWGSPVAAAAVPRLAMYEIALPPAEVPARLAVDDLGTALVSTWEADVNGQVFAHFDDLAYESISFSSAAYMVPTNGKSWLVALAVPDGARLDLRTALLVTPEDNVGTSAVTIADGDSAFAWSAALTGAPLVTSAGHELYTIDWEGLATDALGKPYDKSRGDVLFIGRFDEPAADLGASAPDLSTVAEDWYTMDVEGDESARLDLARDAASVGFPGFTAGSTWVIGVECSTCLSPFPLWASVVEVE